VIHPSFRREDGDSPIHRWQQDYSSIEHPSFRPEDGDPYSEMTRLLFNRASIHSPRRWRFPHSEEATRLLFNIQPSTRPVGGDSHSEATTKLLYKHPSIHTPHRWDIPHSEATTRLLCC